MSIDPSAFSLRVSPELLRSEIAALAGTDWQRTEMVVADVFHRDDARQYFESLSEQERTEFLAEVAELAEHCPRRWPVDVGTGGLPTRLLDESQTVRVLAEVVEFLEERCYFATELGYECVDDRGGVFTSIAERLADRLGLEDSPKSMRGLLESVGAERLGECAEIVRDYVARPPGREYHSYASCGWHPIQGMFSPEEGRRYFDDVLACLATASVIGPSLRADRTISRAQPAVELIVDPLRRTALVGAPPDAYLPHGSVMTVLHLVDHLRLLGRHDAATRLTEAHRLEVEADGPANNPHFTLVVEMPPERWPQIQADQAVIVELLEDLSAARWSMTWRPPPLYRRGSTTAALGDDAVRQVLAGAGIEPPASVAFRLRPRPTGEGTQLVVLADDPWSSEATAVEQAVFRHFEYNLRTGRARAGGGPLLRELLQPAAALATEELPRVAVVIPHSAHMQADILPTLHEVCDVTTRTFYASHADAGSRMAQILREFVGDRSLRAVLVARGGGEPEELRRLCTDEVRTAIAALVHDGKTVVAAIGHASFRADVGASFEAKIPGDGAKALRAMLVDHPRRARVIAAESQARIAALPVDDRFPEELVAEEAALRERLQRATLDHEAELKLLRQPDL